jgi:ABC-type uncharacterized transport system substrate-binding protein
MWPTAIGLILTLALGTLWLPLATHAQRPMTVPRIGYLDSRSPADAGGVPGSLEALRQGLRELGYVEGQNMRMEYRYAEGKRDRLPALAAELVRLPVDLIVTWGPGVLAAKDATTTIPIVMASAFDAVEAGFVNSLARPGANVTGLTLLSVDLTGKRLQLLQEALPQVSRVALLRYVPPPSLAAPGVHLMLKETEGAMRALGMALHIMEVRDPADLESAFAAVAGERVDALYVMEQAEFMTQRTQIIALATQRRWPTLCGTRAFVDAGGLMSYGADQAAMYRRAATYIDKILKGAKPADLPVEQPTKFELVINLKTAQTLGITIAPGLLFQADQIIR